MNKKLWLSLSFAIMAFVFTPASIAQTSVSQLPAGWHMTGADPKGYDVTRDTTIRRAGKASMSIKAKPTAKKDEFGSTVQAIRPDDYLGKRVRISGYIRTESVSGGAAFWIRMDGPKMEMLDFDNMEKRSVNGTTDWKRYDLVVDVPDNAAAIVIGSMLIGGTGQMWVDDLKLETVGTKTPKTSIQFSDEARHEQEEEMKHVTKQEIEKVMASYRSLPPRFVNLDFEQAPAVAVKPAEK